MSEVQTWLSGWFSRRRGRPVDWQKDASVDFFQAGWIDSFASVELIEEIESQFQIRFNQEDLSDPRLASLSGLVEMVDAVRQRA